MPPVFVPSCLRCFTTSRRQPRPMHAVQLALGALAWLWATSCGSQVAFAQQANSPQANSQQPNILFVFTDDQAQNCVQSFGNPHIQTRHIDRLAAEGVVFREAFVTTAICCSNRACILTGQHMRRHGIEDFKRPLSAEALARTYPLLLRERGYRTGFFGKFAIGRDDPEILDLSLPADKFDWWYGFPQSINFLQRDERGEHYLTTRIEEEIAAFLKSQPSDRPFCLTVALKEPHGPTNYFDPAVEDPYATADIPLPPTFTQAHFDALPELVQNSMNGSGAADRLAHPDKLVQQMRTNYRLITRADLALGRIREALQAHGFDKNTVIIYSSDHGSLLGAHGLTGKWLMYEESIRVPLIIYDPRPDAQGSQRQRTEMALSIDLAPTMLDLAGVQAPPEMQGRSLLGLVQGEQLPWRSDWYYEHTYANPPQHVIPKSEGVRTVDWKYIRYTDSQPAVEQLFHLADDPREERDLAADPQYARQLSRLREACDRYRRELQ